MGEEHWARPPNIGAHVERDLERWEANVDRSRPTDLTNVATLAKTSHNVEEDNYPGGPSQPKKLWEI